MIVTVTLNPAIDRIISVDRLAFEDRTYISSTRESAGGRGVNASCVLHSFGAETLAVLTSGGETGKRLEEYLCDCGIPIAAVPIGSDIRTNLTITDKHGLTINLNEVGPTLLADELNRFGGVLDETLGRASWVMLCGSLPAGTPPSFYSNLIEIARKRNIKTLLRAQGEPLREGLEAHPSVVIANQGEAERLLERTLLTRTHFIEAAHRIRSMGPESVVLTLGSRGAIGAFPDGTIEAQPPRVDAVCPIGAGDALSAAYTWAKSRKLTRVEALRWGVAAGTASARLPGMSFASLAQTEELYRKVEVRRVE